MKKKLLITLAATVLTGVFFVGNYWVNTQPICVVSKIVDDEILTSIPRRNKLIIEFVETNGKHIAPNYNQVVCTEFVINIIDKFEPLTKDEKNSIRIITNENLGNLIKEQSPLIKGVQTALTHRHKGIEIKKVQDVRPGDLVQFWNLYQGKAYGHCGVVLELNPNESLTLYSSHPLTDGYGKQKFLWPDKAFFVRLK